MTDNVLVLIAAPGSGALGNGAAERVATALGLPVADVRWLAQGDACDIALPRRPGIVDEARAATAAALERRPVDICVIPAAARRKRLLVADMDSSIIQQECIDEMADVLGLKPRIAAITERAMRGELAFEPALRERVGLLAGLSETQLAAVYRDRIRLMPGARTLVRTMAEHGAFTALVSGGFTFFTSRVAHAVGFHVNHANTLEMAGGHLTGSVAEPILGRDAKLATLEQHRTRLGLAMAETLAVGDGANDLAMVKAAGLGVAYRAKPVVAAEAMAAISHGDLTALLYLQGYARSEHVEA